MDSTIIDGMYAVPYYVIYFSVNGSIENFNVIGNGSEAVIGIGTFNANVIVRHCRVDNIDYGITIDLSTSLVEDCIIKNCGERNIRDECAPDTCHSIYRNNIIISNNASTAVYLSYGGYPTFINNIVIDEGSNSWNGIFSGQKPGALISNNLVGGYTNEGISIGAVTIDTTFINNNILFNNPSQAIVTGTGNRTIIKNNILRDSDIGINKYNSSNTRSDYNLFWNVQNLMMGQPFIGNSNIVADPMFVNDTIPTANGNYDFHLQKYSPAIDKGDPSHS